MTMRALAGLVRRIGLLGLLGLLALPGTACTEVPAGELQFLIDDASVPLFELATVGEPAELFSWTFEDEASLSAWGIQGAEDEMRIDDGALSIRSRTDDPRMSRPVDLDARTVRRLEVRIAGLVEGSLKVYWAGPGEEFAEERSARSPAASGPGFTTLSVAVARHFRWRGRIRALRIDPTDVAGEGVRIEAIRGLGHVIPEEHTRRAAGATWRVGLSGDYRAAILGGAGVSIERRVEVPEGGGRLHFGYGVACLLGAAGRESAGYRFEVVGRPAGSGGAGRRLFEEEVPPSPAGTDLSYGEWREASVDLPAGLDPGLSLTFRADSARPRSDCLAAWADPTVAPARAARPADPDVVLVSIDTLRSDRVSLYTGREGLTPEIDAWARRRAVAFPNGIAAATWTLPSHVSMLTGLDALSHGVNHERRAPGSLSFLAERLRAAGYATVAFTGGGFLHPRFGFSQGFGRQVDWTGGLSGERELATNMSRFLDWLEAPPGRPFFAFFQTYEVHEPYRPRQPYFDAIYRGPIGGRAHDVTRVERAGDLGAGPTTPTGWRLAWRDDPAAPATPELVELASALYDSGVAHTDAVLGRLFDALERLGLAEDTIVVLTSDHGEALGEDGLVSHGHLSNDNLLVPLIVSAPGITDRRPREPGRGEPGAGRPGVGPPNSNDPGIREERVASVDIVPTILELVGLDPSGLDGRSLLPLLEGRPARPRPTWSYSPAWGVSLRLPGGREYLFDPGPWPPRRGFERLHPLLPGLPEARGAAATDAATSDLRRRVVERLRSVPGFRVLFTNGSARRLQGTVSSRSGLTPFGVEAPEMECACLEWTEDGTIAFTVPAGAAFTLSFHELAGGELTFDGSLGDEAFHLAVRPGELASPRSLALDGSTGNRPDGLEEGDLSGDAGLTFWWVGPLGSEGTATPADPELLERLRALGYLR